MKQSNFAAGALERLRAHMKDRRLDACVVTSPVHVAYLSGVFPLRDRYAAVIVSDEQTLLVTPGRPAGLPDGMELAPYEDYSIQYVLDLSANFASALEGALPRIARSGGRLGIETAHMAQAHWRIVERLWRPLHLEDVGSHLQNMRMVKLPAELPLVQRAVEITDRMYAAVAQGVREGDSEIDAYLACLGIVKAESLSPTDLEGDFVSGPRTEAIGGPPSARRLEAGDLLILDLFPRAGTHCADHCRTYIVGAPRQEHVDRHALLVEALESGERAITPGLPARELYAVVRSVLERAGMAQYFPHHAGHGIGVTPSERPRLIPGSAEVLAEGMCITLEPGVYLPGRGGMRIEDNFLVTAGGSRRLTGYPRRLTVL